MSGRDEDVRDDVRDVMRDAACDADEATLDDVTRSAVAAWREEVPVRATWRAELLRAVDASPAPRVIAPDARRAWSVRPWSVRPWSVRPWSVRPWSVRPWSVRPWSVRPWLAIAASLAIAAVSAGVGYRIALDGSAPGDAPRDEPVAIGAASARANVSDVAARSSLTRFALVAPGAHRVALVGDFNRWDPARMPMRALGDGRTWVLDVPLHAGRHVYAFVVDGDLTADPSAPRAPDDDFGVPSSVVLVMGPG